MDTFSRGELHFDVTDTGAAQGPVAILLHGFPQTRDAWSGVTPDLAAAGYRVLVPAQRGYSPGARPRGRSAYRMGQLVADVVALADHVGASTFHLVGHDWGGAVAWALAAQHPDRLRTLTSVSTPHPRALVRAMLTGDQALRSWYMGAFQLPLVPERLLLAGRGAQLRGSLERSGLAADQAAAYVAALGTPGALAAALNWYRAVPLDAPAGRRTGRIGVPTLYVWGDRDVSLGRAAAQATGRWVSAAYRFETLAGVSHWIPEQEPETLVRLLIDHLRAAG